MRGCKSMSKKRRRIDPDQLSFDFDRHIKEYTRLKHALLAHDEQKERESESFEEACIEVSAAIKQAIRETNMSREQIVDAINDYFGWPGKEAKKGKHLSIHMFNHYLSKPAEYPIPTFYIYAIQHITGSLIPTMSLAEAEGARVISGDEVRQMAVGKLDETILEMQKLKRDLRGGRSAG